MNFYQSARSPYPHSVHVEVEKIGRGVSEVIGRKFGSYHWIWSCIFSYHVDVASHVVNAL